MIRRERLFERLDNLTRSPVIWVSAPGGAGKTSLVASYLNVHKYKGLWYQIDSGDSDLSSFFYYLGLATTQATPRKKPFTILLTPEYLHDLQFFIRRYFRELFKRLPSESVIVFDNFQDADSPQLAGVMDIVCEEVPESVTVYVISRVAPPIALTRHIANQKIALLPPEELKTQLSETQAMLGLSVDGQALKFIQAKSNGWAAGVVLMREHLRRAGEGAITTQNQTPSSIFDYFAG